MTASCDKGDPSNQDLLLGTKRRRQREEEQYKASSPRLLRAARLAGNPGTRQEAAALVLLLLAVVGEKITILSSQLFCMVCGHSVFVVAVLAFMVFMEGYASYSVWAY